MSEKIYNHLIKTLLIGSSGVGKSSISNSFSNNIYNEKTVQTIGVDLKVKTLKFDNEITKFQLWDTAGHERFRSLTSSYYRGADCVIIVFDLTNRDSFKDLVFWLDEIKKHTHNILYYLVGNKSDLINERKVEHKTIEQFIVKYNINNYLEVSAKDNINIETLFINIIGKIKNYKSKKIINEEAILPPSLLKKKVKKIDNKCCIII